MQNFRSELQRGKVLQIASGHVVAGWFILKVALSLQAAMSLSPGFGAYDRMHPVGDSWWWTTTGFPEWARSLERKRLMRERKLEVCWREHAFPPQCKPVGNHEFSCT